MANERSIALKRLLARLPDAIISGDASVGVATIEIDSRSVRPGALFIALRGTRTDGHRYLRDALANGAAAAIVEEASPDLPPATLVRVPDSHRALSRIAAAFYDDPSEALDVVGVTGTNGKTTTTHMIAGILEAGGVACGVLGTVGAIFRSHRRWLENTTPLPPELHRLLAAMRDEGARAVAMEVSSHALALERVEDVRFRAAVLTNVTRDHLDFHGTLEAYAAAKRRLFSFAPVCVLNADDACAQAWARALESEGRRIVLYGNGEGSRLVPRNVNLSANGAQFVLDGQRYSLRTPGLFNVWNALAAIAVGRLFGVPDAVAARGLAELGRVPGRMEWIEEGGVVVVVDYAHTPDALENVLTSLREIAQGALAVVFGCGGDRDRGKRPEMGAVAARLADRLYVTSDNPRGEDPQTIVDAILAGIGERQRVVELDRRRAIARAIGEARSGDVVLVAGKGHEGYQIVGDRVMPFDDLTVAREALAARKALR